MSGRTSVLVLAVLSIIAAVFFAHAAQVWTAMVWAGSAGWNLALVKTWPR